MYQRMRPQDELKTTFFEFGYWLVAGNRRSGSNTSLGSENISKISAHLILLPNTILTLLMPYLQQPNLLFNGKKLDILGGGDPHLSLN